MSDHSFRYPNRATTGKAVLDTVLKSEGQGELAARLLALVPGISAQIASAGRGHHVHTSATLIPRDEHILGGAAKHNFRLPMRQITPSIAKKMQRGRKPLDKPPCPFDGLFKVFKRFPNLSDLLRGALTGFV